MRDCHNELSQLFIELERPISLLLRNSRIKARLTTDCA